MHVEPTPRRREAVVGSGGRASGVARGGEQGPGHGGGVEGVQVVEEERVVCRRRGWGWKRGGEQGMTDVM